VTGARLTPAEVESYLAAVDWLTAVIGLPEVAAAWDRPSALADYSVGGVAAHAVHGGLLRLEGLLREPAPPFVHAVSVADYFGPNRVSHPGDVDPLFVALRARSEAVAQRGPDALVTSCRESRAALADRLRHSEADRPVAVARVPGGTTPLSDYLRTRVLEVVVHGDDLMASVEGLRTPEPPAAAVEVCLLVCVELARARVGDMAALRAFSRSERAAPDALRVL
jgi:hypothetical protein